MFALYSCANMDSNPFVFGSLGNADLAPYFGARVGNAFGPGIRIYHGSLLQQAGSFATGVAGNAGAIAYFNGSPLGSMSWSSSVSPNQVIIGNAKPEGEQGFPFLGSIQAVVIYSDTLTAGEVATVSAAMAAL